MRLLAAFGFFLFASASEAQDVTYYGPPNITVGVARPAGIAGYFTAFICGSCTLSTVPEAVENIRYRHQVGTCGGNNGGYSTPESCYVESVTWVQPAGENGRWRVKLHSTTYPNNNFGGDVYIRYQSGATPYVDEPAGARDYYSGPTKYTYDLGKMLGPQACDTCGYSDSVGNPISAATGNKVQVEEDLPGPWNLRFVRYYNSVPTAPTHLLGLGWTHTYSAKVTLDASALVATLLRPGGRTLTYRLANGSWTADADVHGQLLQVFGSEPGTWTWRYVETDTRQIEMFDQRGRLTRIDRSDGEYVALTYNSGVDESNANDFRLTDVIIQGSRALKFFYDPSGRINRMRNADGIEYVYGYDAAGRLTQVTYPDSKTRQYRYNESGFNGGVNQPRALTGIIDEKLSRFASFTYNSAGAAVGTEHAGGAGRNVLTYASDGSATVQTPSGGIRSQPYVTPARSKRPSTITETGDGLERLRAYTYDAAGNVETFVDATSLLTEYDYDSRGLETRRIEASNVPALKRTTETDWHADFAVPTERRVLDSTGALAARTVWTYNSRGQALTQTAYDPSGQAAPRTSTYTYCDQVDTNPVPGACPFVGLLKSIDGPRTDVSDVTSFIYYYDNGCSDAGGNCWHRIGDLWRVTNAKGQVTTYQTYNDRGQPTRVVDANGVVTDLEYSPRGWLTARKVRGADNATEADDAITRLDYEPTGDVSKVTLPDGSFVSFTRDAAHRVTDITDATGNSVHYVLDAAGNRRQEDSKDTGGTVRRTLARVYNSLNELESLADASATPIDFTYGLDGSLETTTDRLLRVTDQDTDALGRVRQVIANTAGGASDRAVIGFQYDALDRLTQVTDPKGLLTKYGYNGFGDHVRLESPDTGVSIFAFDVGGQLVQSTDARGKQSNYTYDVLGRLTGQLLPNTAQSVFFDYDDYWYAWENDEPVSDCAVGEQYGIGHLGGVRDESGSTRYCYDHLGNMVRKVQTVTGGSKLTVGATYNGAGRVVAMTYPSGAIVTYLRDANGRVRAIDTVPAVGQSQATLVSNVAYLPFGPLQAITFGNGRVLTKAYDANYDIDKVSDSAASNPLSQDITVDAGGRITALAERTSATAVANRTYSYDGLDRLTGEKNGNQVVEGFSYDATGNRLRKTVGNQSTNYLYAATDHRLAAVGNKARSYDANGNTSLIGSGGQSQGFVYDDRNRLRDYKAGNTVKASYRYNGLGEQVLRIDTTSAATSRQFVYDEAGHLLGEYTTAGVRVQEYVWLDDTLVGTLSSHDGSTYQYVETDHLGTPRAVVHPSKNIIVWRWNLNDTSFGDHAPLGDPDGNAITYTLNLRYPGQRADPISGLNYNYFRDYEAATGRYIESDPIGLVGGASTYGYAGAKPLKVADPLGLYFWTGTATTVSGGAVIGGGLFRFDLTSECIRGWRFRVAVNAWGAGIEVGVRGLPLGAIEETVVLDDQFDRLLMDSVATEDEILSIPDANFQDQFFFAAGFGGAAGWGGGVNAYQFGQAKPTVSRDFGGMSTGIGLGANMLWGASELKSVKRERCSSCDAPPP